MFWKTVSFAILVIGTVSGEGNDYSKYIEKGVKLLCEQIGANDDVKLVAENSFSKLTTCLATLVPAAEVQSLPIQNDEKPGAIVTKLCAKKTELKACLDAERADVAPCLDSTWAYQVDAALNAYKETLDYVCYSDERITDITTGEAKSCLNDQVRAMSSCSRNLFSNITIEDFLKLTETERCAKIDELTTCITPLGESQNDFCKFSATKIRAALLSCKDAPNAGLVVD